jgi:hypothetical protein
MPPTIIINAVNHWTLYATPVIDFFLFSMPIFTMYEDIFVTSKVLLMILTFLVGQQEICLIMVFFVIGNMAFILEVDDNMGHTFIQLNPFS